MSILGLLMTAVCSLYVMAHRTYKKGTHTSESLIKTTAAFSYLTRELRECERIYAPEGGQISKSSLLKGIEMTPGSTPFVFVKYDPLSNQDQVIAYALDQSSNLTRLLYSPDFDPVEPATWKVESVLPKSIGIKKLNLKLSSASNPLDPGSQFLQINLQSKLEPGLFQLESKVKLQGGL